MYQDDRILEKTILHIIDSLGVGGAEQMLVHANIKIAGYRHLIVYLKPPQAYTEELREYTVTCLNFKGWSSSPRVVNNLKKIITQHQVTIIHSHLYYSTIISRLACPAHVRLVSSYHSLLYDPKNTAQYSRKLLLLDRLTYRKRHYLLFVSGAVQQLVSQKVGINTNYEVLHNYVEDTYFANMPLSHSGDSARLRLVMLGNLRPEKNYLLVIKALSQLPNRNFELHIYGEGQQRDTLQELIRYHALEDHILLKGHIDQPHTVLPEYDLYIAASRFEGFGIALAEAMACGLPCLVSEIDAHREVAGETVIYFDPHSVQSLKNSLQNIFSSISAIG